MIHTRKEACIILGISEDSKEAAIKTAYKNLVKLFHPDMGGEEDVEEYYRIIEAYEFLCGEERNAKDEQTGEDSQQQLTGKRHKSVIGNDRSLYPAREDQDSYRKRLEKHRERKIREFDERVAEYHKEEERKEKEYKAAMDAIHAVMAAELIKEMIRKNENPLEQDEKEDH